MVTRILHEAFETIVSDKALIWAHPKYGEYRLLQVADYLCDLERAELCYIYNLPLSSTTNYFYGSRGNFHSHYYKQAKRKRLE